MNAKRWKHAVLEKLSETGDLGRDSAEFIRQRRVRMKFRRHSKSTGARWFLFRQITLNSRYYSPDTVLDHPDMLSVLVHEVHHLKQGVLTALSVYGELDAWQVGFRFYKSIHPVKLQPALEELLSLPLSWDRDVLRRAAELMQIYAGKGYHINWLPLYPLHKEIGFLLTKKKPE